MFPQSYQHYNPKHLREACCFHFNGRYIIMGAPRPSEMFASIQQITNVTNRCARDGVVLQKRETSCRAPKRFNKSRTNPNERIKYSSMSTFHAPSVPQFAAVMIQTYRFVFWDVTSCGLVKAYRRFGRCCHLHQERQKSIYFQRTTRRHNPQDRNLNIHLKSHKFCSWLSGSNLDGFSVSQPPPIKKNTSLRTCF